jgi:two-component system sensor histidine kinase/response regulator
MKTTPVNILLVDDDVRNLDVLESILDLPEYNLVRTTSAEDALATLLSVDFALIVLDVRMPTMSGLELAQLIKQRKKTQHIPIIFLTAYYREDEHVMRGYDAGAVDYLSKPCNPDIIRSKVAVFVELYRKSHALKNEMEEHRAAEQQVRDLNHQLALRINDLAEANGELEAFCYSVSHDLRAPLRQVAGFVTLLEESFASGAKVDAGEYLSLIRASVNRMGQLIDDLLAFSRVGRAELKQVAVDLQPLVERVLQTLQPAMQGRCIDWSIAPLPRVVGDAAMLQQVFASLIDNAVKFTRPRDKAVVEIGCRIDGDEQVFFVRDNGVGFDASYSDKLFGVFQRLHDVTEFEGTGIGLASVRRIVSRHGGRVWAESELGSWTCVYFTLRAASAAAPVLKQADLMIS